MFTEAKANSSLIMEPMGDAVRPFGEKVQPKEGWLGQPVVSGPKVVKKA